MKDTYKDVDEFISDVMPLEYKSIIHDDTRPEETGSNSTAHRFEEKLEKILAETDEGKDGK